MISLNPHAPMATAMVPLLDSFASWGEPPAELNERMRQVLLSYKGSIPPDQWAAFYDGQVPQDVRARLTERYGI